MKSSTKISQSAIDMSKRWKPIFKKWAKELGKDIFAAPQKPVKAPKIESEG